MAGRTYLQRNRGYQEELKRAIKRYNARVSYHEKKIGRYLTPRLSYKELQGDIKNKRQLQATIKKIEKVTTKQIKEAKPVFKPKSQTDKRQEKRRAQIENILVDKEIGRFPSERDLIVSNIGLKEGDKANLERVNNWLSTHMQQSINWKNNYLKGIQGVLEGAMMGGNDEAVELLEELYNLIESTDIEDFLIGQLSKPETLSMKYLYPTKGGELEAEIDRVLAEWRMIIG